MTPETADAIFSIASMQMFKRRDVWGGEKIRRAELRAARIDGKGLGRINAMRCILMLLKQWVLHDLLLSRTRHSLLGPMGSM